MPGDCSTQARALLALTFIPGLGPVRIAQLIAALGSPEAVLGASASQFARIRGIGATTAGNIAKHLHPSIERIDEELSKIADAGAHVISIVDPQYPPMLAQIPSPPPILMVKGQFDHVTKNRYTVSIVGSRSCSIYGSEQANRFAGAFAQAGLTVVSGGARGIDTAAHHGALKAGGSTAVVLGCGIGRVYPPENARLFDEIVAQGGAIISELPVNTIPDAKNFPARNRIISGLSLGVLVIEAGLKSGSLITARQAIEDHGREVMGLPGRVDSPASAGTHDLLKNGAHLVTDPSDVISILERDAFHLYSGSHAAITADPSRQPNQSPPPIGDAPLLPAPVGDVDDQTRQILEALTESRTGDQLAEILSIDTGALRAKMTMLEIQGRVRRVGSKFERVR
tara:strand:+ start:66471 stop:67661 length:1191 start_codon:yes stop_codon:yes gene_type:complete